MADGRRHRMGFLARGILVASVGLAVGGCQLFDGVLGGKPQMRAREGSADWRTAATSADRDRLRDLRSAWAKAIGQARAAGHGADLAALGDLGDPDIALADAAPPPGVYRCRTVKLGAQTEGMLDYVDYPPFQRSEEHTSELQSLMRISYAVFCLKKKIHHTYDLICIHNKKHTH